MAADVELLRERLQDYADGLGAPPVLLHDVGELVALLREADAEIEALRAEVGRLQELCNGLHRSLTDSQAGFVHHRDRAERLAEALRPLAALDLTPDDFDQRPDSQPIYARNNTVITVGDVRKARAALHPTAAQENDDA